MGTMAQPLVSDELWEIVEPLIPKVPRRHRYPGRKRIDDRKVLSGILFVLRTGIGWEHLPQEMGCGSGMTCWRRLREWQQAGVWQRLHEVLLAKCMRLTGSTGRVRSSTPRTYPLFWGAAEWPQPVKGANIGVGVGRPAAWQDRRHGALIPLPRVADAAWRVVRSRRGLDVKDIELLVLRHELEILRRQ